MEIVYGIIVLAVVCVQAVFYQLSLKQYFQKEKEEREYRKQVEDKLLDRIMTRNYETLVQAEVLRRPPEKQPDEEYETNVY